VNPDAVGLSLAGTDFALVIARPDDTAAVTDKRSWFAVKASAAALELVGIPSITAIASDLNFSLNKGSGTNNLQPNNTVIDFQQSFSGTNGLEVVTGARTIKVDFTE